MRFTSCWCVVCCAVSATLLAPFSANAQVIQGTVLDSATGEPIATARVSLVSQDGEHLDTTLTDTQGRFTLRSTAPGVYVLEADRLGYGIQRVEGVEVEAERATRRDVHLVARAVEVDEIVVRGYPGRLIHDLTLAGVYARRARSPSVGNNRVLVRGDAQLDGSLLVRDVLPAWFPRPQCARDHPVLFRDGLRVQRDRFRDHIDETRGLLEPDPFIEAVLNLPVTHVEAVEYYRDLSTAPMGLRPLDDLADWDFRHVRDCGLVAVWTRGSLRE